MYVSVLQNVVDIQSMQVVRLQKVTPMQNLWDF